MLDDVVLALRRSALRYRVLVLLEDLGPSYHSRLAAAAGIPPNRLSHVLFGYHPDYRPDRALVHLKLVSATRVRGRRRYELTAEGREALREIARRIAESGLPRLPL